LPLVALTIKLYPEAKRALIAGGMKPADVEAMATLQVVLLNSWRQYERLRDNLFKWVGLPYWQSYAGLAEAHKQVDQARARGEAVFFINFIPAYGRVVAAAARMDRRIALLRAVEAIRLYAAGHEGKLPTQLADINEVPVPLDPATGKSFDYKLEAGRATITAPPWAPFDASPGNTLVYEITLK
jgi:hypothetical protein